MSTRSQRPLIRSPLNAERELALHVRGDHGAGLQLLRAEAAQRRATRLETRLLVLAGQEALVAPRDLERVDQLGLGHDVTARVAPMELLDGLVQRRAVDHRVVRRDRHPQHVQVAVLARAGQVVVDLAEAERQRLRDRLERRLRRRAGAARTSAIWSSGAGRRAPTPGRSRGRRAGPAPPARTARRVARDCRRSRRRGVRISCVARARHADVEEPPLLLERWIALDPRVRQQIERHVERVAPADAAGTVRRRGRA